MLHSQQLNSSPLCPWVIVENNGKILSGHCTYMAGLGEVCTHVTDQKAYHWVTPSNNTSLQPQELIHIDFRSPQLKRKCIETALITSPTNHLHEKNIPPKKKILIEKQSETELSRLLIFNAI